MPEPVLDGLTGKLKMFLKIAENHTSSCVTAGPLDRPVFCELGKLYNKDSVIELLLDRKRAEIAAQAEEKSKSKKHKKVIFHIYDVIFT